MAKTQVLIRNLEEGIIQKLKEQAEFNHRSLEAEIRTILTEKVAQEQRPDWAIFLKEAAELRETTSDRPVTDSGEIQHEMRWERMEK